MKLYEVECSVTMYVLADDESHAGDCARLFAPDEIRNAGLDECTASEITADSSYILSRWQNALPYAQEGCADPEETCGKIFKRITSAPSPTEGGGS